jgi:hypothetical protein
VPTIAAILANTEYTGHTVFGRRRTAGDKRPGLQHHDYHEAIVTIPFDNPSANTAFSALARVMLAWQITALPGYVIMYPGHRSYLSARKIHLEHLPPARSANPAAAARTMPAHAPDSSTTRRARTVWPRRDAVRPPACKNVQNATGPKRS